MDIVHMKWRRTINRSPAFQFYPKDFISDANVQAMNLKERGAYITLICLCWIEDGIPKETIQKMVDLWLANGSNQLSTEDNIWAKIKHCFYKKDGKYRNKRLDEERRKQIAWSEKSRLGGLKSSESKQDKKGGYTKGQPKANSSSSSSSSSSSTNKDSNKENVENESLFEKEIEKEFEEFWKFYKSIGNPEDDVGNKQEAKKAYTRLRKKISREEIARAVHGEGDYLKYKRLEDNFEQRKKFTSTWLRDERWKVHADFKYKPRL